VVTSSVANHSSSSNNNVGEMTALPSLLKGVTFQRPARHFSNNVSCHRHFIEVMHSKVQWSTSVHNQDEHHNELVDTWIDISPPSEGDNGMDHNGNDDGNANHDNHLH
jgi:hypothetical protein